MCSFKLSSLFLLFGFDFKRRDNPWIRTLLYALKLKSIAILLYYVIYYTQSLFIFTNITKRRLSWITITIKCYVTLISYIVFIRKFPRISAIEEKIRRNLSNESLKNLNFFDRILIFLLVSLIMINFTGNLIIVLLNSSHMIIMDLISWQFNNLTWLFSVQFLFFKIIYEIHLIEEELFQKNHQEIHDRQQIDSQDLQVELELLISLKHSVNTDLGPLVFLYLANLFQSTCFRLSFLTLNTSLDQTHVFFLMIEFMSHVIVSLATIYLVNYNQSKIPSQIDIRKMTSNSPSWNSSSLKCVSIDSLMINKIIKTYCKLDYSPCYMFDINQKFILCYFSTVITFTVMLASIIDQFLK